jgi:hypothetical protein
VELKDQEVIELKHKLDLVEMEKRYNDSAGNKKVMETEKINALIE